MDGDSTLGVHADRALADLPDVAPPIRPSTTFTEGSGRRYRRSSHETTERFEAVVGALEGGHAVAYASGMAAASAILDHVRPRRVALPSTVYHGVRHLVERRVRSDGIEVIRSDDLGPGDLWWIETPSNPFCDITDLREAGARAAEVGAVTVCDATLATPIALRPLDFGVDVTMHATTKAISGHSDAMGGVLVSRDRARAEALREERTISGSIPGSLDVWLSLRGVRTLALRMERACASAAELASLCASTGLATYYPGLSTHPGHDVASRQMRMAGTVVAIDLGHADAAEVFIGALRLFTNATSLGGIESLVERRAVSDPTMPAGLVRLSVGIEDTADLLADAGTALGAVT
jgi:cystathionine gamma-synthase